MKKVFSLVLALSLSLIPYSVSFADVSVSRNMENKQKAINDNYVRLGDSILINKQIKIKPAVIAFAEKIPTDIKTYVPLDNKKFMIIGYWFINNSDKALVPNDTKLDLSITNIKNKEVYEKDEKLTSYYPKADASVKSGDDTLDENAKILKVEVFQVSKDIQEKDIEAKFRVKEGNNTYALVLELPKASEIVKDEKVVSIEEILGKTKTSTDNTNKTQGNSTEEDEVDKDIKDINNKSKDLFTAKADIDKKEVILTFSDTYASLIRMYGSQNDEYINTLMDTYAAGFKLIALEKKSLKDYTFIMIDPRDETKAIFKFKNGKTLPVD